METTLDRLLSYSSFGTGRPLNGGTWLILRGCLAIALGVTAMLFPASAVFAFAMLFAAFAFVDGLLSIMGGVAGIRRAETGRWALVFRGLVGVLVGGLFVLMPYATTFSYALVSLVLLSVWSIFTGVLEIAAAVRLRRETKGEWLLGLSGLLSILLGMAIPIFLAIYPEATLVSAAWMIAIYALVAGAVLIAEGVKVRRRSDETAEKSAPSSPPDASALPAG